MHTPLNASSLPSLPTTEHSNIYMLHVMRLKPCWRPSSLGFLSPDGKAKMVVKAIGGASGIIYMTSRVVPRIAATAVAAAAERARGAERMPPITAASSHPCGSKTTAAPRLLRSLASDQPPAHNAHNNDTHSPCSQVRDPMYVFWQVVPRAKPWSWQNLSQAGCPLFEYKKERGGTQA